MKRTKLRRTATKWRNYLDKLAREAIRRREKCERCGRKDTLQVAHIYTRTYKETRWLPLNLLLLCASCHFWGHRNPLDFTEFVKKKLGSEKYKELVKRSRKTRQWGEADYKEVEEELKSYEI